MSFPSIGEYNQTIISKNGSCLRELSGAVFVPVRTSPIKVYTFGSGANAVVFKANYHNRTYGLRCFLNNDSDRVIRSKSISKYLESINTSWKIDYRFLENEIIVQGKSYPIIQMSWSSGKDLNTWIGHNLNETEKLNQLQRKIVELSKSLEDNNIGHGDIQCGNLLVEEIGSILTLKLIDYDGMYIPSLSHLNAIENGRAEFQHPSRSLIHFRPSIDRFSFLVIITAIELLKHDKSLWRSPLQNGFNSLDNLLFSAKDFKNYHSSELFRRARNLNSNAVNFYINQLTTAINSDISRVNEPSLFQNQGSRQLPDVGPPPRTVPSGLIRIESNVPSVVLNGLRPLGQTPIELDKNAFTGKELNVSNGRGSIKKVTIRITDSIVKVEF
jgi:NADPH-dependent 7-cyano-7-deazaguanine reductase QueF-like protein